MAHYSIPAGCAAAHETSGEGIGSPTPPQTEPLWQLAIPSLTAEGQCPEDGVLGAGQSVTLDEGEGRQPMLPGLPTREPCSPNKAIVQGPDALTWPY